MKTYKLLFLLPFLFCSIFSFAESRKSVLVLFGVIDEVTREDLTDVSFVLRCNDSIVVPIDTLFVQGDTYVASFSGPDGMYKLWASKEGYMRGYNEFRKKSERYGNIGIGDICLQKERVQTLHEATVVSTHIKMVMRGDTIVYDAAAFNLAEGSMLDALISQLPGAELNDGQITVNGKPIASLLINGEDFFQGNPRVALENMPSYTIRHIKVYNREARDAYLRGGKTPFDAEDLVMDVSLKKKYSYGFLGNIDTGYGWDNRYYGKAFGLGYRDGLRLAAYANFNNTKDTSSGSTGGGWSGGWGQDGELDLQMGGIDYLWKKRNFRFSGNVMTTGEDADVKTRRSTEAFYDSGDTYGRASSRQKDKKFHLLSSHHWSWSGKKAYLEFQPSVDYLTNNYTRSSRAATFSVPILERYRGEALDSLFGVATSRFSPYLLNRVGSDTEGTSDWIIVKGTASSTLKVPGLLDEVHIYAVGDYRKDNDHRATTTTQAFGSTASGGNASIGTLQERPSTTTTWHANAGTYYQWWYRPMIEKNLYASMIQPKIDYQHASTDRDNLLYQYRTELAAAEMTPSAYNISRLAMDVNNSYHSTLHQNHYTPSLTVDYAIAPNINRLSRQFQWELILSEKISQEALVYHKAVLDTTIRRTICLFLPEFEFEYSDESDAGNTELKATYSFQASAPGILYSLSTTDTSSPTDIYLNNPQLKKAASHQARLTYNRQWNRGHRSLHAAVYYRHTDNSIAQARYYDVATGVSTWRPENVNNNWNTGGDVGYTLPFGRKEAFQFNGNTTVGYVHSVDYSTTTDILTRSVVNNLTIGQQAGLSYRIGPHTVGLNGGVSWRRARSVIHLFETINAFNYNARLNSLVNMGAGWQLSSDLNLYARRGYSDNTLNTTDWIWNATLSKSFLGGKLTTKIEAVDLLAQVSQVRYEINAQGRTETWVNSLPRYVMLHLIYRFQILPKKG